VKTFSSANATDGFSPDVHRAINRR
jgi:hypothetical protein